MLLHAPRVHSFSLLSSIPPFGGTTVGLAAPCWWTSELFPAGGCYKQSCLCPSVCTDLHFLFSWVKTEEWNGWS